MNNNTERLQQRAHNLMILVIGIMSLLALRTCYLSIFKSSEFEAAAARPSQRSQSVPAARGLIFDRKGKALAINRLCYEVGVCYRDILGFPAVKAVWKEGKRNRIYPRRELVNQLVTLLASHLKLPRMQIEDFIYSEAALNPSQTIVLDGDVGEEVFYQLITQQAMIPGLRVRMGLKRHYPLGSVGGQVIGYLGPINLTEHRTQREILSSLQAQLSMEEDESARAYLEEKLQLTRQRLVGLEQIVGKAGVELAYETQLRGEDGKQLLFLNAHGHTLHVEEKNAPIPGKDIKLCIDADLQLLAEELLAQNEMIRDEQLAATLSSSHTWVKGGSVIVMDPHTGHILALASYPRFNPDLFSKPLQAQPFGFDENRPPLGSKHFWLEDRAWIEGLWNGSWDLWREIYDTSKADFIWQRHPTTWNSFLEAICGAQSALPSQFSKFKEVHTLWRAIVAFDRLKRCIGEDIDSWSILNYLYSRVQDQPYWIGELLAEHELGSVAARWQQLEGILPLEADRRALDEVIGSLSSNFDKMLMLDLIALLIDVEAFDGLPTDALETISCEKYREDTKAYLHLKREIKSILEQWHREGPFALWREEQQKRFLKEMRREEKVQNRRAKPYLYYLETERKKQFDELWQHHAEEIIYLLISSGAYESSQEPMIQALRKKIFDHPQKEQFQASIDKLKEVCSKLNPREFEKYLLKLRSFEDLKKPLWARYPRLKSGKPSFYSDLAAMIYPRYGLGYMNNRAISYVSPPGSVYKLVVAYEALLQRYNRGITSWDALSPLTIVDMNYRKGNQMVVGKWASGKEISQIYHGGRIPKSQRRSIGQIDFLGAIEASSNPYFSLLADQVLEDAPQDIIRASHELGWARKTGIDLPFERAGSMPYDLATNRTGLFTTVIGQHTLLGTPMQSAVMMSAFANGGNLLKPKVVDDGAPPEVRHQITMPSRIREYLFEGMRRVVSGERGSARSGSLVSYGPGTPERKVINKMVRYMIGKTSTAEFVEVFGLSTPKILPKHSNVWFAGIVFEEPLYQGPAPTGRLQFEGKKPELVIIVCLNYGRFGKEAFPIAALLANYWKEQKQKEATSETQE